MARILSALLLLVALSSTSRAAIFPANFPTEPGYHAQLKLPGHPEQTYDLYLPRAYFDKANHPDVRFPVVYLLCEGRNSKLVDWADEHKVLSWAETYRCVVVGVNTFFDAEPSGRIYISHDNTLRTSAMDPYIRIADALPRAHPNLRFVLHTDSFSSPRNWFVALRFPNNIAGFTFGTHNVGSITTDVPLPPRTCAVAAYIVTRDAYYRGRPSEGMFAEPDEEMFYPTWQNTVGARLRQQGSPFRTFENIDWKVGTDPVLHALTWMLDTAWLTHPKVSDAERKYARASAAERLAAAAKITDPVARKGVLDDLLTIPALAATKEGKAAYPLWRTTALAVADTRKVPYFRHQYLRSLLDLPMMAGSPELALARRQVDQLSKDPAVLNEAAAFKRLIDLGPRRSQAFGNTLDFIRDLRDQHQAVIDHYPNTLSAIYAKRQTTWLDRLLRERAAAEEKKRSPRAPLTPPR